MLTQDRVLSYTGFVLGAILTFFVPALFDMGMQVTVLLLAPLAVVLSTLFGEAAGWFVFFLVLPVMASVNGVLFGAILLLLGKVYNLRKLLEPTDDEIDR